jgi:general secretion pathway protein I
MMSGVARFEPWTCGPGRRTARGFSLLETIAAILLLAIAVAALMRVASASLNLTDRLGQTTRADMLAQGKLDGLGIAEPLRPGEYDGMFDRDYRWHLRIVPWQDDDPPKDSGLALYRVELHLTWGDTRHPREMKYVTLRAQSRKLP